MGVREWGIDGAIGRRLAAGPATREELIADGVPPDAIDRRIKRGHVAVIWPGVYRLAGSPLNHHDRHVAATLACGPRSVLSSFNTAVEWAIVQSPREDSPIHVIVPKTGHRRPRGITTHRADLTRQEVRRKGRLLLTGPARTLQDLAAGHPDLLERAINEAFALNLLKPDELEAVSGRRGARHLRRTLDARADGFDRSKAERILLRLILRAGFPRPERNVQLGRYQADFLWSEPRLVVEIDGYAGHSGPQAFARDRRKDRELTIQGYTVIRFTWPDLRDRPERVIADLARLLG